LNYRQAWLAQELGTYNIGIIYYSSSKNRKLNAPSMHLKYCPRRGDIAKSDKNWALYTMLNPEYYGTYDREYNISRASVIWKPSCKKFWKFDFAKIYREISVIANNLNIVW
jgi:hypothetical protein